MLTEHVNLRFSNDQYFEGNQIHMVRALINALAGKYGLEKMDDIYAASNYVEEVLGPDGSDLNPIGFRRGIGFGKCGNRIFSGRLGFNLGFNFSFNLRFNLGLRLRLHFGLNFWHGLGLWLGNGFDRCSHRRSNRRHGNGFVLIRF